MRASGHIKRIRTQELYAHLRNWFIEDAADGVLDL